VITPGDTLAANQRQVWSEHDPYTVDRYAEFAQYMADGQAVLDIGCNTGRGGVYLRQRFPNMFLCGVELLADRLARVEPGVFDELVCGDIVSWSTPRRFDRIIAGEVVEHVPPENFHTMLCKCRSLLTKRGQMIITTPNPRSLLVLMGRRAVFRDASHVNLMTPNVLGEACGRAGLRVMTVRGSGKATRLFGRLPMLPLYGSYLAVLEGDAQSPEEPIDPQAESGVATTRSER
jgi:2-polyprenyl-3-methyl-5-hydroxy-6-metoxy-1,4-benzoquinol methylase